MLTKLKNNLGQTHMIQSRWQQAGRKASLMNAFQRSPDGNVAS
jgi:hypothetical protein